jgi:hypothetical protein
VDASSVGPELTALIIIGANEHKYEKKCLGITCAEGRRRSPKIKRSHALPAAVAVAFGKRAGGREGRCRVKNTASRCHTGWNIVSVMRFNIDQIESY